MTAGKSGSYKIKIRHTPFVICVCASLFVLLGVIHIKKLELDEHNAQKKVMVNDRLSQIAATLSQSINTRLNNTRSFAAFVKVNRNFTQKEFDVFATSLQKGLVGLRSLQLTPKGIVTYITNLENNRAALGHDLFADPKRRHIVIQSVKERKLIIAGPIKLLQGGQALIARQPLFLPNTTTGKSEFWDLRQP